MTPLGARKLDGVLAAAIFVTVTVVAWVAMGTFRADGHVPYFYQSSFESAVLDACGRGFGSSPVTVPELTAFLNVQRNDFPCELLPDGAPAVPSSATGYASWRYLYRSSALVWRFTGVSWPALDSVVAVMAGLVGAVTYGLMRLATGPYAAAGLALLLALSPANMRQLPYLRDYSKAPFVLAALLILALLVVRPLRRSAVFALAALYGAVVGLGYGFRADLAVMVPFGAGITLLFLAAPPKTTVWRKVSAAAILLLSFLIFASPVIRSLDRGGCQFHFSLLGLTESAGNELHLAAPIYRFGDFNLDIFGTLKVGDYGSRIMHRPPSGFCDAASDETAGRLYWEMVRAFPADIVVRAYASVLMILRMGMDIPAVEPGMAHGPSMLAGFYRGIDDVVGPVSPIGVLVTLAGIAMASAISVRLGVALAISILFLAGYPSLRFEERHWFHLRFIPWWAAALVATEAWRRGRAWDRGAMTRAVAVPVVLVAAMVAALAGIRSVQARGVRELVAAYLRAPVEELAIERGEGSRIEVRWQPVDYGVPPEHRGSDLLAVTLDATGCGTGPDPVTLMVKYAVDNRDAGHDLSTSFVLARPAAGAELTRVFVPVFWAGFGEQTYLRFVALEVEGGTSACVQSVARVTGGEALPLWLGVQVAPGWDLQRLYQTIDPPPQFKSLIKRPL